MSAASYLAFTVVGDPSERRLLAHGRLREEDDHRLCHLELLSGSVENERRRTHLAAGRSVLDPLRCRDTDRKILRRQGNAASKAGAHQPDTGYAALALGGAECGCTEPKGVRRPCGSGHRAQDEAGPPVARAQSSTGSKATRRASSCQWLTFHDLTAKPLVDGSTKSRVTPTWVSCSP